MTDNIEEQKTKTLHRTDLATQAPLNTGAVHVGFRTTVQVEYRNVHLMSRTTEQVKYRNVHLLSRTTV
jgi:hypothetical protein